MEIRAPVKWGSDEKGGGRYYPFGFWQVDPLADVSNPWSPFAFGNDNPILYNDYAGLLSDSANPQELAAVTVIGHRQRPAWGGFYWPTIHKDQARWSNTMYARIRDGRPLQQKGDPAWLAGQVNYHKQYYRAGQESRKMQLGAVMALAAPIAAGAIIEAAPAIASKSLTEFGLLREGANIIGRKYGVKLVGAITLNIAQNVSARPSTPCWFQ